MSLPTTNDPLEPRPDEPPAADPSPLSATLEDLRIKVTGHDGHEALLDDAAGDETRLAGSEAEFRT